ncbi:class I SAM-dependent RNA methyltransferase [Pseudahrensia aquimaris]|uniref:Class I SAM-dependent RNA methyltransferase n=1 Tax=Pseudahrensia aquimaris TaxID=744461 RepID=A0ABW3FEU1_9HYPH
MKIDIRDVGALGDGVGEHNGLSVFVPYTLAGESVVAEGTPPHLALASVEKASAERVEPPCPHFGTCGGCAVQHWERAPYLEWKRGLLANALAAAGLDAKVAPCVPCDAGSRRRATFSARRTDDGLVFGFHEWQDEAIVQLSQCPVLHPAISSKMEAIAKLCPVLMRGREIVQVLVTQCDNGLDLAFTLEQMPSDAMEADFVRAFSRSQFLRASANGAILVEREKPIVSFGAVQVAIAPGTFLQTVPEVEAVMARDVAKHLAKSKRIVDLFSGSGTFALRLAQKARVHAVESDGLALEALATGAGGEGLKPVTTEERDLFEAPLTVKELNRFDGICLDPPRAGAAEQVANIAKSDVKRVAYVSCSPASLARDLKVLVRGGYQIDSATPYDQFLWSPHVEAVVTLSRPKSKAQRPIFGRKV